MIILAVSLIGLAAGSFINALVWRLQQNKRAELTIWRGRSMCPKCRHLLSPIDLIPVLSWLFLGGKCRYCKKNISVHYPIVELVTALVFISSYVWWPYHLGGWQVVIFGVWLILVVGLLALLLYDLFWKILPNKLIYPFSAVALVMAIINVVISNDPAKALLNEFLAVIIGGGLFYVLFQVSSGKWIGGGDVKLGAMLGLIAATPGRSILMIFLASLMGSLLSLPLLLSRRLKRDSTIPFGPFLIVAIIVVQLFGHNILHWYQTAFFPYTV